MTTYTLPFTQANGAAASFTSLIGLTVPNVSSNALICTTNGTTYAAYYNSVLLADMQVQMDVTQTGTGATAICTRLDTSGNGYSLELDFNGTWFLNRIDAGALTQLATGSGIAGSTLHTIKLMSVGSTHRAFIDSRLIATVTDATYLTNSRFGMIMTKSAGTTTADNMVATDDVPAVYVVDWGTDGTGTLTKPASLANGDLLVYAFNCNSAGITVTGLTKVGEGNTPSGGNTRAYVFGKHVPTASSEPASWSASGGSVFSAVWWRIQGHDTSTPFPTTSTVGGSTTSNAPVSTAITPGSANNLLGSTVTWWDSVTPHAPPTGFTMAGNDLNGGDDTSMAYLNLVGGSGVSQGPFTWSPTGSKWSTVTFLVKPAGSGTNVNPSAVAGVAGVPSPTIVTIVVLTPAAIAGVAGVPSPALLVGIVATPAAIAAFAGIPAPSISVTATLTPAAVAATAGVPSPAISAGARPTPLAVAGTAGIPAPTLTASATLTPSAVAAAAGVPSPALTASSIITVAAVAAIAGVPLVAIQGTAITVVSAVAATAGVPAPTVTTGTNPTPAAVAATAGIPSLTIAATATVTAVAVAAVAGIPSVAIAATARPIVGAIAAVAAIPTPTVTMSVLLTPSSVSANAGVPTAAILAAGLLIVQAVAAIAHVPLVVIVGGGAVGIGGRAAATLHSLHRASTGQTRVHNLAVVLAQPSTSTSEVFQP